MSGKASGPRKEIGLYTRENPKKNVLYIMCLLFVRFVYISQAKVMMYEAGMQNPILFGIDKRWI